MIWRYCIRFFPTSIHSLSVPSVLGDRKTNKPRAIHTNRRFAFTFFLFLRRKREKTLSVVSLAEVLGFSKNSYETSFAEVLRFLTLGTHEAARGPVFWRICYPVGGPTRVKMIMVRLNGVRGSSEAHRGFAYRCTDDLLSVTRFVPWTDTVCRNLVLRRAFT